MRLLAAAAMAATLLAACAAPVAPPAAAPGYVRIEVTPQACVDAISGLIDEIELATAVIEGYTYDDLTDATLDEYLAHDLDPIADLVEECLDSASTEDA